MKKRRVLERTIERAVVDYAKKRGVFAVKLNGMGMQGLPDRMFLGPGARRLFIEFKREGAKPTALQAHLHAAWERLDHTVHVVDNVQQGKGLIDVMLAASEIALQWHDRMKRLEEALREIQRITHDQSAHYVAATALKETP